MNNSNSSIEILSKASTFSKLSHELRTPVHGIRGISSYLYDHWALLDQQQIERCLLAIKEASGNLTDILDSMQNNISDQGIIEFELIQADIVCLLNDAIDRCKSLFFDKGPLNISLNINKHKEYYTNIDKFWFTQLIINLISNALNYSNDTNIEISLRPESDSKCYILIKDNGIGVSDQDIQNIFYEFKRGAAAKKHKEGVGLGLSICKEIVEAHGGAIRVYRNEDRGSTVEFYIKSN